MALTPEDVVNKRFQHVKFRDGYDQDEVYQCLDAGVVEIVRLYQANDELRHKPSTAEQRVKELEAGGATAAPAQDSDATQARPAAVPTPEEPAEAPAPQEEQAPAAPAPVEETQASAPVVKEAAPAPAEDSSASGAQAPAMAAGA